MSTVAEPEKMPLWPPSRRAIRNAYARGVATSSLLLVLLTSPRFLSIRYALVTVSLAVFNRLQAPPETTRSRTLAQRWSAFAPPLRCQPSSSSATLPPTRSMRSQLSVSTWMEPACCVGCRLTESLWGRTPSPKRFAIREPRVRTLVRCFRVLENSGVQPPPPRATRAPVCVLPLHVRTSKSLRPSV